VERMRTACVGPDLKRRQKKFDEQKNNGKD
jgi:hypothetical protein